MNKKSGFVALGILTAAVVLGGLVAPLRAQADNNFTVELRKSTTVPCTNGASLRVDMIENGTRTTHYTGVNGSATFTVATPTNNENLTIEYYKTNGTLAGSITVTILDPCSGPPCSDPWDFGKGASGANCDTWFSGRTVHITYNPS